MWLAANNHRHLRFFYYALCILHCAFISSCARMGTPDGGPYDETPPRVVRTSPKYGAANENKVKKIVIEFDEFIKIDNPSEKVVISPPQIEQPEIEASGKRVTVTLLDSLRPNMTYTIDFADAIVDNNEGNPYGDYAFTFSTGERVDTFQVSGHVLNAENLEPIKGIPVGLYKIADKDSLAGIPSSTLPDSIFRTRPFERISRTDSRGHFVVKGLSPGHYQAFALKDLNQNYLYDQRAEMIAFSKRILSTSSKPDIRPDTVWHDSIHYDSIVMVPYTHYYPDDIVLTAFESPLKDRHLLKAERPILQQFSLYFTAPSDTLPHIEGLNFDAHDAFVIDASAQADTIHYWVRDSLIYNLDTLQMRLDFYETDTTGQYILTSDTLRLIPKLSKERMARQEKERYEAWVKECKQRAKAERRAARRAEREKAEQEKAQQEESGKTNTPETPDTTAPSEEANDAESPDDTESSDESDDSDNSDESDSTEVANSTDTPESVEANDNTSDKTEKKKKRKRKKDEDEDLVIPPMPEVFLNVKVSNLQSMDPDKNIDFTFEEPLDSVDLSKIHFSMKVDSLYQPAPFLFRQVPGKIKSYRLYAEWEADSTYQIEIDTAAFVNIYGKRSDAFKRVIKLKPLDAYSTLFVALQGTPPAGATNGWDAAHVQLINNSDKVAKTIKAKGNKADFYFIAPGIYYLRLFYDLNGNGRWDTGNYDLQLPPEPVYYYPGALTLKAQWEITQEWSPTALPLPQQKPLAITKQKPEKERTIRSRNAERQKNKGR